MKTLGITLLLALSGLWACGGGDDDLRSQLVEYRVLAIKADPPAPSPEDSVTLTATEYDPIELDPTAATGEAFYVWEVCPLSIGALQKYKCLDPFADAGGEGMGMAAMAPGMLPPDIEARIPQLIADLAALGVSPQAIPTAFSPLLVETDGPEITLEMDQVGGVGVRALFLLCAAFSPDGVCRGIDRQPRTLDRGWELYVKLFAGREGVIRKDVVTRLRVGTPAQPNQNPSIAEFTVDKASAKVETEVTLSVILGENAVETYDDIQFTTNGEVVVDGMGKPVLKARTEELLFSWFATGGKFDSERTVGEDGLENTLTLPEDAGTVRVYVVIRDGRGGFAVKILELEATE